MTSVRSRPSRLLPKRCEDRYAACVGRFYEDLAARLEEGARRVFEEAGAELDVYDVPGRLRAPAGGQVLRRLAAATPAWPASGP